MVAYIIVMVDTYGHIELTCKCFANRDSAIKFCDDNNKETYDYLQSCADKHRKPGNYELFEFREIEVEE